MRWRLLLCALLVATRADAFAVKLAWDAPAVGVPEGYTLYKKVGTGQYELLVSVLAPATAYTDNAVSFGQSCWQVTAYNAGGESAPSNEVCFFVPVAPGSPGNLRLIP